MKLFAFIVVLVALSGCASGSLKELKQTNSGVINVQVDEGYQALYRRSLDHFRGCWSGGLTGIQYVLESDLYTDIHRGDLTFSTSSLFGQMIYMLIEISRSQSSADKSDVTIYYHFDAWETRATNAAAFLQGEGDEC